MSIPLLLPLEGMDHMGDGGFPFESLLGVLTFVVLLLIIGATILYLRRHDFSPTAWLNRRSHPPEAEAQQILAERFARGDISTEDFMDRASVLNWTPGSDVTARRKPKGR